MTQNLTRKPVTAAIHPDLLEKLMTALHPAPFGPDSTLYHMGVEQAKSDFRTILTWHLNEPAGRL